VRNLKVLTVLLVAFLAAIAAGCGGSDDAGNDAAGGGGEATSTMPSMEMEGDTSEGAATGVETGVESPAADLRFTLDRLLGEHALLAMFATQKGFSGAKDFEAAGAALDENSVELGEAIGSVYGDEAGQKFLEGDLLWRDHIGFFVDYTVGLAKKDKAMQKKAVGNLQGYNEAFATFLAGATELPQDAVRDTISEHIMQLKGQIDAYSAGRYPAAYDDLHAGYEHMIMTGDTISGAITKQNPDEFASDGVSQSASDLRVTLGQLLGEHAMLAMVATQKGFSGEKDFKEITKALDRNSIDLANAIGSVYGDEAAKKFLEGDLLWRDHIGFFVDYTVGLAKKDKAMQKKAVGNLMGYNEAFATFLAEATGLPQDALRDTINEHIMQLKGQIDAYAAGDYEEAYSLAREAYAHMYMTGTTLAGGIGQQNPDKFSS
jgi:hypothetical protein